MRETVSARFIDFQSPRNQSNCSFVGSFLLLYLLVLGSFLAKNIVLYAKALSYLFVRERIEKINQIQTGGGMQKIIRKKGAI